jgi:hypothetical protein
LLIYFGRAGPARGRVGMTFCPGKRQQASMTGGWERDLGTDLDALFEWGARVLVSLMEPEELRAVGVPPQELAREAATRGIEWVNLSIVDGSIPGEAALEQWRSLAPSLHELLEEGGSVVFHCLGGLGRTGTMAACLLIESGLAPADAIAAVRAARPGTIENASQEEFVLRYQRVTR